MRKEEFLKELERLLSEQLPREAVVENIQYYEKYIDSQIQNGRSEQDVMNELGSPHLIAKTIVETSGGIYFAEQESASQMERQRGPSFEKQMEQRMRSFQMNCLAVVLVALLVVSVILVVVGRVIGFVFGVVFRVMLPVVLIAVVVALVAWWITKRR